MDNIHAYDAHAHTIRVDVIAADSRNRIILRRLQRNDSDVATALWIQNEYDEDEDQSIDYCPEGAYDMGWLGYFVGKNEHLRELHICPFTPTSGSSIRDVIEPFFRGVSSNNSIQTITFTRMDLLGGEVFTMLTPFFKDNYNLANININNCDFGNGGCRLFALALGSSTNKSLQKVELEDNNISEEGMVDIITALSMHPHLKHLDLDGNRLRKDGCVALATLLRCSAKVLQQLFISRNEINDEGLEALLPALATCRFLNMIDLLENPSITTKGWQRFATILEAPNSTLSSIDITRNNIDHEAAASFASALANNHTFLQLHLRDNPITDDWWQAFLKLLCDTSSVNSTFLSNHTLLGMGGIREDARRVMQPLLDLNARNDKKEVAVIKILQNHEDFDMLPFFEWEFKYLPLVLNWLERASECEMPRGFEPNIEPRKLSTINQFVRGLPLLYVESRLRKELEDIQAKEKQMEEEELQEEILQRKQLLQERKESIMNRLGGNLQQS